VFVPSYQNDERDDGEKDQPHIQDLLPDKQEEQNGESKDSEPREAELAIDPGLSLVDEPPVGQSSAIDVTGVVVDHA
jgi:hypothetical protein